MLNINNRPNNKDDNDSCDKGNNSQKSFMEQMNQYVKDLDKLEASLNQLKIAMINTYLEQSQDSGTLTAQYIMNIVTNYWENPKAVKDGRQMLKKVFELMMQIIIQPENYQKSIGEYVTWQNKTVKCFIDLWSQHSKNSDNEEIFGNIEQAWNWDQQLNEGIFLGGAARPLFTEKVTNFADLLSSYYNKLDPIYVKHRSDLFNALYRLICEESEKYWKNYELFPSTTSLGVIEKCLYYFYFRDRNNTYFINSSGADYIPFVHLALQTFSSDKFIGSPMTKLDEFNTEEILKNLIEQCTNICNKEKQTDPLIIILLTSKNRFGTRIDVDQIHRKLAKQFSGKIVTIVDACQDGQAFHDVDIILYSKRFTAIGAVALINKKLIKNHDRLKKNLALVTNFPITILAQLYVNINMINEQVAIGVEDLVNSAYWNGYGSSVLSELKSVFNRYSQQENSTSSIKIQLDNDLLFEFTEDELGTIVMIRTTKKDNVDEFLSRLMSKLKEQGHTLDSFLMNDSFRTNPNTINVEELKNLIRNKDLNQLRAIESRCNAYLAWPLVPFSVLKSADDLINEEYFNQCEEYHRCLRISVDRSACPGKLKRFINILQQNVDQIEVKNAIAMPDQYQNYSSQWAIPQ